jgi:DNA-directed RNA polymerase subunit RPC12/RpoP
MGIYNILHTDICCPRCGEESMMEIDLYFGYRNLIEYRIGDKVEWFPRKAVHNGGRPETGNLDGEGYVECPRCKRDFFVLVHVRGDVIESVEADRARKAYVPDEE